MEMLVDDRPDAAAESFANSIAAALRARRKLSGKTLAEVAHHCNTSPQTIQRLETGNMTLSIAWMARICAALEMEPSELFGPPPRYNRSKIAQCLGVALAARDDLQRTASYLAELAKEG